MNKLLEIRDKAVKFYGEYENYIFPMIKFIIAFTAFLTIDLMSLIAPVSLLT